ncbi:MAG: response regulator [Desulfobulbaceae bacterium]|nr:MAG: response regulator [Desulfobulbaceae bacterium]
MEENRKGFVILVAEDDDDDFLLTREVLEEGGIPARLVRVRDGEELMEYLLRKGEYADPQDSPPPSFILLDLNMPRKDGREALQEIKSDPALRRIPVVVFTTSRAEEDIAHTYLSGANSFIRKPVTFADFARTVAGIKEYWEEIVTLPPIG